MGTFILWLLAIIGGFVVITTIAKSINTSPQKQDVIKQTTIEFYQKIHLLTHYKIIDFYLESYIEIKGRPLSNEVSGHYYKNPVLLKIMDRILIYDTISVNHEVFIDAVEESNYFISPSENCLLSMIMFADWARYSNTKSLGKFYAKIAKGIIEHYDDKMNPTFKRYYNKVNQFLINS